CTLAADPPRHLYDIAPQAVSSALKAFATQSGMQLIYTEADVGHTETAGVSGELSPEEALAVLLKGTALRFELTANHVIVVQKASARAIGSPPETPGSNDPEAGKSPGAAQPSTTGSTAVDRMNPDPPREIESGSKAVIEEIVVTAQKISEKLQDV